MIKTLLNLNFIALIASFELMLAQSPQTYISFEQDTMNLFAYEGAKTMILSNTPNRDSVTMQKWLASMDGAYEYYSQCTGREPNFFTGFTYVNDRSTIARVDKTCGAACGYIGWTGIEIMNTFFDRFYDDLKKRGEYGQEPFYEFGRNYWFYSDQLEYAESDPIVTGYAVFMRFMAMDYLQLKGANFWSWTFDEFRSEVKGLLMTYLADPSYTWENTLAKGQGLRNTQLGATDLFASFCFYMFDNHGGHEWVKAVWKEAGILPKKNTTQDAVDNFIIASSRAAKQNLIPLFTEWRWPISQKVREVLQSLPLSVHETTDKLFPYPNPVSRNGVITFSNSAIQQCRLIDLHGKRFELQVISPCTFSIGNVPAGIYMVQCNNDFNLPHSAICIQD
jgi:hypothetical protein